MSPLDSMILASAVGAGALAAGVFAGWYARGRGSWSGENLVLGDVQVLPSRSRQTGTITSELRDLLAAATEHADELVSVTRADGRLVHANRAFCRALDYDVAALRAMQADDCLGEQNRGSLAEIAAALQHDSGWRGTLIRRRRDGTTFLSSCSVLQLRDNRGDVSHFVAVERDITQDNHLREQLIHSERLAAVGQLVSGVAHELNNPLQSIIGFTELLIDAERRKEARSDLEQIRASAHRAAKIVRNLLAFVRKSSVERTPASLNELLQSTLALRKYEFAMSGIELVERYADDLPPVLVNREEVQQVILNLVLNAEQAMKPLQRPGRLLLRTAAIDGGVCIELEDNGPGVPVHVAGRIFEPFYTTKGVGEGTGLGLSIALGIAQAHGGTLELLASCTGGARFRMTLPKVAGAAEAPGAGGAPHLTWSAVQGRRALVADDEPALRKLLHRLLTRRGFAVDVAEDGSQASRLIDVNRYDIILCDVQMPRMTGPQLYESLRRRQPQLAPAFVLISGDIPRGQLQALISGSQIPLLSKPFGARNLDLVLEQVLAHRSSTPDPPPTGPSASRTPAAALPAVPRGPMNWSPAAVRPAAGGGPH